jgi:hypothetical protein
MPASSRSCSLVLELARVVHRESHSVAGRKQQGRSCISPHELHELILLCLAAQDGLDPPAGILLILGERFGRPFFHFLPGATAMNAGGNGKAPMPGENFTAAILAGFSLTADAAAWTASAGGSTLSVHTLMVPLMVLLLCPHR